MCAVVVVLSIVGSRCGFFSKDLLGNMDGILILGVCNA